MGIDKHLILTLDRSKNRQYSVFGGATAMQTPPDKIRFVKGHDDKGFDGDMNTIADEAEVDGFEFVRQFAGGLENKWIKQSPSGVCQAWNFCRILRYIAMGSETCIITWDDRILTLPFPFVDKVTSELQKREEEFYMWQLRIRFGNDRDMLEVERIHLLHPELIPDKVEYEKLIGDRDVCQREFIKEYDKRFQIFLDGHYKNSIVMTNTKEYVETYLIKDKIGYDESLVISPKGAAWLLIQAINMKELDPDNDPNEEVTWENALNRRSCFDAWISFDLNEPSKKAIADGKGIYCPKRMEYKYVHDWLPMGSDVEWGHPDNEKVQEFRRKKTDINFLDIP